MEERMTEKPRYRTIATVAEAEALRGLVETIVEGWYPPERHLDFADVVDRLERQADVDLGSSMTSPAIRHLRKIVTETRRAMSES
jgi:hypothetical protein